MEKQIYDLLTAVQNGEQSIGEAQEQLLLLFSVSKRHLIENILDDVKQSHSEYAVEKIESYLDDDC